MSHSSFERDPDQKLTNDELYQEYKAILTGPDGFYRLLEKNITNYDAYLKERKTFAETEVKRFIEDWEAQAPESLDIESMKKKIKEQLEKTTYVRNQFKQLVSALEKKIHEIKTTPDYKQLADLEADFERLRLTQKDMVRQSKLIEAEIKYILEKNITLPYQELQYEVKEILEELMDPEGMEIRLQKLKAQVEAEFLGFIEHAPEEKKQALSLSLFTKKTEVKETKEEEIKKEPIFLLGNQMINFYNVKKPVLATLQAFAKKIVDRENPAKELGQFREDLQQLHVQNLDWLRSLNPNLDAKDIKPINTLWKNYLDRMMQITLPKNNKKAKEFIAALDKDFEKNLIDAATTLVHNATHQQLATLVQDATEAMIESSESDITVQKAEEEKRIKTEMLQALETQQDQLRTDINQSLSASDADYMRTQADLKRMENTILGFEQKYVTLASLNKFLHEVRHQIEQTHETNQEVTLLNDMHEHIVNREFNNLQERLNKEANEKSQALMSIRSAKKGIRTLAQAQLSAPHKLMNKLEARLPVAEKKAKELFQREFKTKYNDLEDEYWAFDKIINELNKIVNTSKVDLAESKKQYANIHSQFAEIIKKRFEDLQKKLAQDRETTLKSVNHINIDEEKKALDAARRVEPSAYRLFYDVGKQIRGLETLEKDPNSLNLGLLKLRTLHKSIMVDIEETTKKVGIFNDDLKVELQNLDKMWDQYLKEVTTKSIKAPSVSEQKARAERLQNLMKSIDSVLSVYERSQKMLREPITSGEDIKRFREALIKKIEIDFKHKQAQLEKDRKTRLDAITSEQTAFNNRIDEQLAQQALLIEKSELYKQALPTIQKLKHLMDPIKRQAKLVASLSHATQGDQKLKQTRLGFNMLVNRAQGTLLAGAKTVVALTGHEDLVRKVNPYKGLGFEDLLSTAFSELQVLANTEMNADIKTIIMPGVNWLIKKMESHPDIIPSKDLQELRDKFTATPGRRSPGPSRRGG